ncbi:MAG TPA: hypothetical protein VE422_49640 [Terriglobia bacterium]|nr:hypothetical protein [Terriglobia bacterium]
MRAENGSSRTLTPGTSGRRTSKLCAVAVLLVAAVIGIAWLNSPRKTQVGASPNRLLAAIDAQASVNDRLNSAEEKLNAWPKERTGLTDQMAQLEKSVASNVRRARAEALALVEGVKREMRQGLDSVQSRLGGIESTQSEMHNEVARLQDDLAAVQRDLAAVREAAAQQTAQVHQIDQAQQSTQGEVSGLHNQMLSNQSRVDTLYYQVERQRVDFEVSKDRTSELVAGIYLTIHHTDVARQQIGGWLQIASDGRFVWLRDAGAQHPIAFSSQSDERAYQLVFTRIADGIAAGYIMVPVTPVSAETAAK